MKTYITYVVEDNKGHKHLSEVLETRNPQYTFSPDTQVHDVIDWADKKRKELKKEENLVITGIYKI